MKCSGVIYAVTQEVESPSVRGCGLKCYGPYEINSRIDVTLSARVWIEITGNLITIRYPFRHPQCEGVD